MAHKPLGFMQLTIICGFSLYYAYYLITFFGLFLSGPTQASFVEVHAGQVVFFLGSIITTLGFIAAFHRADSVAIGHTRFLYLASLVPGLLLPAFVIVGNVSGYPPLPLFYATCLLSGASIAVGFMLWEDLSTHGYLKRGVLAHGVIFCAGGIVFLLCALFLPPLQMAIVAVLLLVASTALLAFITPRCDTLEDKQVAPVKEFFQKVWHLDIVVGIVNVAFGYAFIVLYHANALMLVGAMGIAFFADLVFSVVFGRGKWILLAGSLRICVAFAAGALLLLAYPGDVVHSVALGTLVVFWFIFRTMNSGSLNDLANHYGFSILYSSTRGKLPTNVGFLIGLAVGVASVGSGLPEVINRYVPLALVALLMLAALFFLPFDNESSTAGYKTLALVDMHENPDSSMHELCDAVSRQFKLSPRETEVLAFLVRGRNAKHISEKLFISESTAKTHISNIYRKLGVHSQQELLDALDELR